MNYRLTADAIYCPLCGGILNTTGSDKLKKCVQCVRVFDVFGDPRRMTVSEVLAEGTRFFHMIADNVEHGPEICHQCGSRFSEDLPPQFCLLIGGSKLLSRIGVQLMCRPCINGSNNPQELINEAPAIEEIGI